MKSNISKHPCQGKCTDFKEEQCKTCLVQDRNIKQWYDVPNHHILEQSEKYDFLIGDTVVLDTAVLNATLKPFDGIYNVLEVYENSVCVLIDFGRLTLNKKFVRAATVVELQAKRRLTKAEQALAEVS